jgi:isopenicillin N synthase-like dioxygenase
LVSDECQIWHASDTDLGNLHGRNTVMPTVNGMGVPVVDLTAAGAAAALASGLQSASCLFVVGHGAGGEVLRDVVEVSREFFALPRAEKALVEWPGERPWSGWQPVHEWSEDKSGLPVPDLLERFEARLPMPAGGDLDGVDLDAWAATFRLWPARPASMARCWTRYYATQARLASRLVSMIADEMGLPAADLPAWTEQQFANLVVNHYPAQRQPAPAGQVRTHPHTDIGGVTILWADDAPGGLEVIFPGDREWTPVLIPPDAFLIQAGDLLARWTNHRIRANVHRVVNPAPEHAAHAARTSVVFFHHPDLEVEVRPAPSTLRPGRRPAQPLHAGRHVIRRQGGRATDLASATPAVEAATVVPPGRPRS